MYLYLNLNITYFKQDAIKKKTKLKFISIIFDKKLNFYDKINLFHLNILNRHNTNCDLLDLDNFEMILVGMKFSFFFYI
jgi:hypothetical protein